MLHNVHADDQVRGDRRRREGRGIIALNGELRLKLIGQKSFPTPIVDDGLISSNLTEGSDLSQTGCGTTVASVLLVEEFVLCDEVHKYLWG